MATIKDETPQLAHAVLSASGAHRWIPCPGSRKAEAKIREMTSSYAAEGTAAHFLGERCLSENLDAKDFEAQFTYIVLGEDGEYFSRDIPSDGSPYFAIDAPMCEYVQEYVDYVRGLIEPDGQLFVEERVDFSKWVPEGFGTADAIVINPDKVHVIDLKYGKGVRVLADNNPQGMLYALGVLNDYGFMMTGGETIEITIVQPRLDSISVFHMSQHDLLVWGDATVKPAAELAMTDDAPRVAGDKQCTFCKAKATCPMLVDRVNAIAIEGFGSIEKDVKPNLTNIDELTPTMISKILTNLPLLKKWISSVEDHAKAKVESGEIIPGWKMVAGRGNRSWDDEEVVAKILKRRFGVGKAFQPRKVLSPAQAEKLLGKDSYVMKQHVVKKIGASTLAPENDKRPAIEIAPPFEGFDDVSQ